MQEIGVTIFSKKRKPKASIVYNTYWKFAYERQNIFFNRLENPEQYPWTNDLVLKQFKFTNAYRVSDRVSQYLITKIIQGGSQKKKEVLFRILLFKIFNKIETWEYLKKHLVDISYADYEFKNYSEILTRLKLDGYPIYSNAYIMASGKASFNHTFKHDNHLKLLETIMNDNLVDRIQRCASMEQAYNVLLNYPTIGPFLAYQFITDINYSDITSYSEMEFVKAGPGAKDGIKKCFSDYGDYSEEDIIKMVCDNQEKEFERLEIDFKTLWGRKLQLIDCQNLFCEVDKYARVIHPEVLGYSKRTRIKQRFKPSSFRPIEYNFPYKWNLKMTNNNGQKA